MRRWKLLTFWLRHGRGMGFQPQKLPTSSRSASFMLPVNRALCALQPYQYLVCFLCLLFCFPCSSCRGNCLSKMSYLPFTNFTGCQYDWFISIGSPVLGIKEVYYGCANDKFGGCGSILSLHLGSCEAHTRFISLSTVIRFLVLGDKLFGLLRHIAAVSCSFFPK